MSGCKMFDFQDRPKFSSIRDSLQPGKISSIYAETTSEAQPRELNPVWHGMSLREKGVGVTTAIAVGMIGGAIILALIG